MVHCLAKLTNMAILRSLVLTFIGLVLIDI